MKPAVLFTTFLLALTALSARAQVQTLVVTPANTNSAVITVSNNCYAVLKSGSTASGGTLLINLQGANFTLNQSDRNVIGLVFGGPATIQLQGDTGQPYFTTVDVESGPLQPGKTLTVGANSGNVQVALQTSTDLVNWTTAVSGQTYTNSPTARFFRMQEVVNP